MRIKIVLMTVFIVFAAHLLFGDDNAPTVRLPLPAQLGGGTLPHFSIRDRRAETHVQRRQLSQMVEPQTRRVALIYFATWCVPCAQGAQRLANASDELIRFGVQPIFVNTGESDVAAINAWVDRHAGANFARLIDPTRHMARQFGLVESNGQMVTPKTLVLDRDLKPLFLLGEEGIDYPEILWLYKP